MKNDSQSCTGSLNVAEDARLVHVARVACQQLLGLLAAVAAEVGVQQVDHRPQVAALLDVDLEQVAQVVQRRTGVAEPVLLLDRSRLGVALGDDDAAELGAELARHLLPDRLADRSRRSRWCGPGTASARKMPQR